MTNAADITAANTFTTNEKISPITDVVPLTLQNNLNGATANLMEINSFHVGGLAANFDKWGKLEFAGPPSLNQPSIRIGGGFEIGSIGGRAENYQFFGGGGSWGFVGPGDGYNILVVGSNTNDLDMSGGHGQIKGVGAGTVAGDVVTLADIAWTHVQGGVGFQNSWVDAGGSLAPTQFRKDGTGRVDFQVAMKSGATASIAFTLPAGYRPANITTVIGTAEESGANVPVELAIASTGTATVTFTGSLTGNVYVTGCFWNGQ